MDPNECLRRILELLEDYKEMPTIGAPLEIAKLTADLDDWLAKGGALPERWAKTEAKDFLLSLAETPEDDLPALIRYFERQEAADD